VSGICKDCRGDPQAVVLPKVFHTINSSIDESTREKTRSGRCTDWSEQSEAAFQAFEDALAARRAMPNVIDDTWLEYETGTSPSGSGHRWVTSSETYYGRKSPRTTR
jgi:hypothetical protein